jgi:hypothetical protein
MLCASDVLADITDFEHYLDALVAFEDPSRTHALQVPRMHYIRQLVHECLEPLCADMPEVFDSERGVPYGATERAHLARRTESLLRALRACQTLDMCERELRIYCTAPELTQEELRNTRLFMKLANTYSAQFRPA